MADYLAWVRHPDGKFPLFNDGGGDGSCEPESVLMLAPSLSLHLDVAPRRGGRHFRDTGIAVWHGDPWTVFYDVGPIGPDYQPGHGHADTLTLETSYRGQRLFVDPAPMPTITTTAVATIVRPPPITPSA